MSPCSSSCACGMISLSTKLRTVDRISCWMSVRSAVCARRAMTKAPRGLRCPWLPVSMSHRPDRSAVCLLTFPDDAWWSTPMSTPPPAYGPPPSYGPSPGYPQPGYPYAWGRPTNTMAILALVMAFVFPPAGLILGVIARKQIRQTGEDGDGLALAGIIVGGIATALFVLIFVFAIAAFSTATSLVR